jgi:hydroxymethylpyrimidine pyrophosphatase-like HAD family hydrolase
MAAIIVDIDDTLLRNGTQPMRSTIDWVNRQSLKYDIYLVTGRNNSMRDDTVRALSRAGVKYNRLIMNTGSSVDSDQFKRETAGRLKTKTRIALAVDNSDSARAAYSSIGIPTKNPSALSDSTLKLNINFGGTNALRY